MFDYMETDEVADLLGVGPAHVRWLARNQPDRVGARKFGRSWIYQREAVEAYAAGYERRRGRPANDEDRPATPPCRTDNDNRPTKGDIPCLTMLSQ
ncbi:MAG TPA: helix-turn-helix domain-containing protein [Bellilinea sp.]|nr:helix-turn-helix domain-containing protein [Bellilinea sp.]